ncbi:YoaK family protein [Ralstonia sp. CHL-2022]|uniref:YoaK family protein n=1 Tax=Ralstonia mojiangensis TaxID=2953895 RepID=A0AAE3HZW2_9RALS|nr:YoaK family protein [Ralstonia mojiangensis]MCT7296188.1 YoaK family protein [Ralstonia mojiangensis]MCT7310661.1 YoaK family protein [Ralstonia mojiangensis]MCT7314785.1 YoaK family protein [Ralstonia mojiangensis]MCT7326355.1 YoaK family protein [Ralstonia mojiangensis]
MPSETVTTATSAPASARFLIAQGTLLAFVAGYVDVVGFAALFGLFTAHVTGNFVMIGLELAGSGQGVLAKLLALPMFVVAVAATKLAVTALTRRGVAPLRPLLLVQAVLLLAFMAAGLLALPIQSADAPATIVVGLIGVAAMGVQNAKARIVLSEHAPTTIMTGNTTQIVIDVVELLSPGGTQKDVARTRLRKMVPPLAGFAVGAVLGALAFATLSFWCVLPPAGILVALAVMQR